MADWSPPAGDKVVDPAAAWTPPASDKTISAEPVPKEPAPPTTASGLAASAARGLAPYAAGATIGAAAGAPFAGVGAVPGAIAGIGATAATELGGTLYNAIAPRVSRLPTVMTPQGATDRLLDAMGIKRPATTAEHMTESAASMLPLGASSVAGQAVASGARATRAEKYIEDAYDRAIRPTVVGKGTAEKMTEHDRDVATAIHKIIGNQPNLRLATAKGEEVVGRYPHTLDEFVQAIAQTKRPIFDKYDALTKQGDALGLRIDTAPAVAELRQFAADPSFALERFRPMREYATATADSLEAQGAMLPSVAQKTVRNLNEGLTGFYRGSSPEAASKAAVDDLVANQLRTHVDGALEKAGLPGWQEARNEYGALKAIEGEVAHRAGVYGRQDPAGGLFGRLGSIATYHDLAHFATTFEPSALAGAMAIRGGRAWKDYWYGPNATVRRMFKKAEKNHTEAPADEARDAFLGGGAPPGGLQPPRPTGPAQNLTGTQGGGTVQGGGSAIPRAAIPTPAGVSQFPVNPFLTPPGGGKVSMIDPNEGLARAFG